MVCKNKNILSISLPLKCSEGRRSRRLQRRSPPELGEHCWMRRHAALHRHAHGRQSGRLHTAAGLRSASLLRASNGFSGQPVEPARIFFAGCFERLFSSQSNGFEQPSNGFKKPLIRWVRKHCRPPTTQPTIPTSIAPSAFRCSSRGAVLRLETQPSAPTWPRAGGATFRAQTGSCGSLISSPSGAAHLPCVADRGGSPSYG
jgi:hypothetical protein